jgi:hypothetical protein
LSGFVTTVTVMFWYAWLFNHPDGSVLISLMAHTTEGSIQAEQLWPTGAAAVRMSLRYAFA